MTLASEEIDPKCKDSLRFYEDKYGGYFSNGKYSDKDRIDYLTSIEAECDKSAWLYIFKSKVYLYNGVYDAALDEIQRGIDREAFPIGNLFFEKAKTLKTLKKAGILENQLPTRDLSYVQIAQIFNHALKLDNTANQFIYLALGETLMLSGDLEGAIAALETGAAIDPDPKSRFFSLGAVVESKRENYVKVAKLMEIAIQKGGEAYLKEPDSVLAIAMALCHLKRKDLAENIVAKSGELLGDRRNHPDWLEAANVVKECDIPVVVREKLY